MAFMFCPKCGQMIRIGDKVTVDYSRGYVMIEHTDCKKTPSIAELEELWNRTVDEQVQ